MTTPELWLLLEGVPLARDAVRETGRGEGEVERRAERTGRTGEERRIEGVRAAAA